MSNEASISLLSPDKPGPISSNDCKRCGRPIRDRYVYQTGGRLWHGSCLECSDCGESLRDRCFYREGLLFCSEHFYRRFGTKCALCDVGISPKMTVQRSMNHVYHIDCFRCMVCSKQLAAGCHYYLLSNGKVVCKQDLEKAKEMEGLVKRPRTNISSKQQEVLRTAYERSPKPPRQTREDLAKETGLPQRVVQVWFQNRRAKDKRKGRSPSMPIKEIHRKTTKKKRKSSRKAKSLKQPQKKAELKNAGEGAEAQDDSHVAVSSLAHQNSFQSSPVANHFPVETGNGDDGGLFVDLASFSSSDPLQDAMESPLLAESLLAESTSSPPDSFDPTRLCHLDDVSDDLRLSSHLSTCSSSLEGCCVAFLL